MNPNNRVYALAVVAAIALAAIMISGMNSLGYATGTTTLTVTGTVGLSAPTNTVNLGTLAQFGVNNTYGDNPPPFTLQNDGNVKLNITVGADNLWSTDVNPTWNYTYNANVSNEGACYLNGTGSGSIITPTPMNATGSAFKSITFLNYTPDSCDSVSVEIAVRVPTLEPTGAKSSSVTFTGTQAS